VKAIRRIAAVVAVAVPLLAQEDGSVGWDPKSDGPVPFWQQCLGLAVFAISIYGYWRLAIWYIAHRREHPRWRALRYWWPSAMLGAITLTVLLANVAERALPESALNAFGLLLAILNAPLIPGAMAYAAVVKESGWEGWPVALTAVPTYWFAWYGIIRFLEWRSECAAPTRLFVSSDSK